MNVGLINIYRMFSFNFIWFPLAVSRMTKERKCWTIAHSDVLWSNSTLLHAKRYLRVLREVIVFRTFLVISIQWTVAIYICSRYMYIKSKSWAFFSVLSIEIGVCAWAFVQEANCSVLLLHFTLVLHNFSSI